MQAKTLLASSPAQAIQMCHEIIESIPMESHDSDSCVRAGDIFALMIEYWYSQSNMQQAYQLIEAMRSRGIIISPYVDAQTVETIYRGMGFDSRDDPAFNAGMPRQHGGVRSSMQISEDVDDDFIDEEAMDDSTDYGVVDESPW